MKSFFNIYIFYFFTYSSFIEAQPNNYTYITDTLFNNIKTNFDSLDIKCPFVSAIIMLNRVSLVTNREKEDSIYLFHKLAFDSFPHECYYVNFNLNSNFTKHVNNKYPKSFPKSYKYMKMISDSIVLTYNKSLQDKLKQLLEDDQKDRNKFDKLLTNKAIDENKVKKFSLTLDRNDQYRFNQIDSIVKLYGYPGKTLVGSKYSNIALTLIQHGPSEYQLRYYPIIYEAVRKGELYKSEYAYFIDRLLIGLGRKQLFGNQYVIRNNEIIVFPIGDPDNLNERRRLCNLAKHEDYIEGIRKSHEEDLMKRKMAKE